ncbi:STAS domain-containing protein [uncultured Lacinutrix sp.]|uniref:STAS domain-containing protein n=1 Tax=uncultured Lacinutrix sp. TaxID=574032 RepID=UPI0026124FF0|nr:STAS domain-containing protein [uncultured Lacinutrix sp.]
MNFEIINNKGVFEIHGDLTKENTQRTKEFFDTLLDRYYEVVISLKKVRAIDKPALKVLQFISEKAKRRSKTLFVLANENCNIGNLIKKINLNTNDY